jgi:Flp pilus assembly protein TadG
MREEEMNRSASRFGNSRGAVIVWVTILMVVFLAFAALAVDLGFVLVTRNELQNISDATSLAGARVLGLAYEALPYEQQLTYVADADAIYEAVEDVAGRNRAGGVDDIEINTSDITIGRWDTQTKVLTPTLSQANAVRVVARRDESANAPLQTFFARILGEETASVSALASAALTGQSRVEPGGLPVPFAISQEWFTFASCNQPIQFYPTGSEAGCAGWHTYDWGANASNLGTIIDGLIDGSFQSPETVIGESFEFIGGNLAARLPDLKLLYDANKDEAGQWIVNVPVYSMVGFEGCRNPNTSIEIVGFATATITNVLAPPQGQLIEATVVCDAVEPSRGGGSDFGTLGSIPGLVQ